MRSVVGASVGLLLILAACGAIGGSRSPGGNAPTGLAGDHVLLTIDEVVDMSALEGVHDPRFVSLTADGTLMLGRQPVDAVLSMTVTKLDSAGLQRAWSEIGLSGVFTDGNLALPGFPQGGGAALADVFRVDDGRRSTRLTIAFLGSEQIPGVALRVPSAEMARRAAATRLIDDLSAMGGRDPWTPPALLMWWRTELPADWDAKIVGWSLPVDLATAGNAVEHPIWQRCARLDGDEAASVARLAHALPNNHLVELGGVRYAIHIRAIHADEIDTVACP
jgi:hypothetical protein